MRLANPLLGGSWSALGSILDAFRKIGSILKNIEKTSGF